MSSPSPDWPQYEAVVERRWDHYRPRFERFSRGGWLSWNWGAFFATFAWLRYRRMTGWAWAYLPFSVPALLVYWMAWQTLGTDSCLRALSAPSAVPWTLLGFGVAAWLLPPLIGDRLYFAQVRAIVEKPISPAPGGVKAGVWGDLVAQVVPLLIVMVAAPSYGNYVTRAKVSEGVALAGALKAPLAEYLADRGTLPGHARDIAAPAKGRYVREVTLGPDGTIRAIFGGEVPELSGRSVEHSPRIEGRSIADWTCRSKDLPAACLPSACRQ